MSQHIYLVNVTHNSEKNEIVCYFENKYSKIAKKFLFFPKIKIPREFDLVKLKEILVFYNIKNFDLIKENDFNYLICKKFEDIKKISNLVAKLSSKKVIILDPIRNFLVEKDWSYFDSFVVENDLIKKVDSFFDCPEIIFKEITFIEAKKIDESNTAFLLNACAVSNLTKIPLNKIPKSINGITEAFLENMFFKNAGYLVWGDNKKIYSSVNFGPFGYFEKVSQIDFSPVWVQLLTNTFFNIGQETINCNCCKPIKLDDSNLLPSTLIEVVINEDNLFFESTSNFFRANFHKNNLGKELRVAKKKEFWLKSIPLGPFFKSQKIKLPLLDAKLLLDEEKANLSKDHTLNWVCVKKESFLSKEIKENLKIIKKINLLLTSKNNYGLFFVNFSDEFMKIKCDLLTKILYEIPFQLSNLNSSFFNPVLAESIISIQEATISKFNEFSEKSGYRVLYSNKKEVFVRGYASLSLAKSFSNTLKLPQPAVLDFTASKKF